MRVLMFGWAMENNMVVQIILYGNPAILFQFTAFPDQMQNNIC